MNDKNDRSFMKSLAAFIVDRRIFFAILFALLAVFSVFSMNWVNVEDDITHFLPDDAESKRAIDVLTNEFDIYGTAQIIVEDTTVTEAESFRDAIAEVEHVVSADFDPEESFKENTALIDVSLDLLQNDEKTDGVLDNIKEILSDTNACIYCDVGFTDAEVIDAEMTTVLIIFFVILIAVLILSSQTYGEVLVLLITLASAALLNMGTHFIFGTISLIAEAVSVVMQLALSIDYAIIFCNRYKEEREKLDKREAVVNALSASIPAIFSSSLTTIAGLFAMTLMTFRLGGDLGSVLIKAIIISLVSVFIFMPALLYFCDGLIMRTKHPKFIPQMGGIGKFSFATRKVMPILFAVILIAGGILVNKTNYSYNYVYTTAVSEAEEDRALRISETLFQQNNYIAILPSGDYAAEKAVLDELNSWDEVQEAVGLANTEIIDGVCLCDEVDCKTVCELAEVDEEIGQALFAYYAADRGDHRAVIEDGIENYKAPLIDVFTFLHDNCLNRDDLDFEIDEETVSMINELYGELEYGRNQSQSKDHSAISISTTMPPQGEEVSQFVEKVHALTDKYYGERGSDVLMYGDSMFYRDFETSFKTDNVLVSVLSILFVLVILFFTFKSAVLSVLLIAVIQGSIWINFSIPVLTGSYVYFACFLIVSAIQMGSNIDYAIVMSSRYLEFRQTKEKKEAIKDAVALAFPTVITSGLLMACAGLLMYLRVSENITANMGKFICIGAVVTMVLVLFVLPQLLLLFDTAIAKTTLVLVPAGKEPNPALRRKLVAGLLVLVSVAGLVLVPLSVGELKQQKLETDETYSELNNTIENARPVFESFDENKEKYDDAKYAFAESYIIDLIGSAELEAGQKEYDEGAKQLADGEKEYAAGRQEYEAGLSQYIAGKKEYEDGLKQYKDGEKELAAGRKEYAAGKNEYDSGKKEYEDGLKQYEEGKKAYEEGLKAYEEGKKAYAEGKKIYDEGLAEYNAAKAEFDEITELYNTVAPSYERYKELKEQDRQAEENGDYWTQAGLAWVLRPLELVFESDLSNIASIISTDQSIIDALKEYRTIDNLMKAYKEAEQQLKEAEAELRAGEKELADGKKQLEDAEAQLAAGKKELEDAEAQLKAGKKELDAGEQELKSGEKELKDGEKELAEAHEQLEAGEKELKDGENELKAGEDELRDAEKQLSEGRKELDAGGKELSEAKEYLKENREKLEDSIVILDEYVEENGKVETAKAEILSYPELKKELAKTDGNTEILNIAKDYCDEQQEKAGMQVLLSLVRIILVMISSLLLLLSGVLMMLDKARKFRTFLLVLVIILLIGSGVTLLL